MGASKSPHKIDFKNQQIRLAFLFSFKDLTNFGCPNLKFHLQISVYGYASYEGFLCVRACNCCLKASEFSPNNMLSLVKHYIPRFAVATKGNLISEQICEDIVFPKLQREYCYDFCPESFYDCFYRLV